MVQNRLYFVYPARQVNAIRRTMLGQLTTEFAENQMYLTTDVRPFKPWFLTQMCARFSPSRSAAPWEEGADALVPANQR